MLSVPLRCGESWRLIRIGLLVAADNLSSCFKDRSPSLEFLFLLEFTDPYGNHVETCGRLALDKKANIAGGCRCERRLVHWSVGGTGEKDSGRVLVDGFAKLHFVLRIAERSEIKTKAGVSRTGFLNVGTDNRIAEIWYLDLKEILPIETDRIFGEWRRGRATDAPPFNGVD